MAKRGYFGLFDSLITRLFDSWTTWNIPKDCFENINICTSATSKKLRLK